MKCFFCGSSLSVVVDKRAVSSTGEIRRRRECLKCHQRYTTYEKVCAFDLSVIKRSGEKELFDRSKIKNGILKALEKRPAIEQVDQLIDRIVNRLKLKNKKQIESKVIGRAVLMELKKIDSVGYLRFASVYRNFDSAGDFTKELEHLKL